MDYIFTVNLRQTKDRLVSFHDYDRIWDMFDENQLLCIYRVEHKADKEIDHLHYHGLVRSNGTITFKNFNKPGQDHRIEFKVCIDHMNWFHYCMHEYYDLEKMNKQLLQDKKERQIYDNFNNAITYIKPIQTKIKLKKKTDTLFTITIG